MMPSYPASSVTSIRFPPCSQPESTPPVHPDLNSPSFLLLLSLKSSRLIFSISVLSHNSSLISGSEPSYSSLLQLKSSFNSFLSTSSSSIPLVSPKALISSLSILNPHSSLFLSQDHAIPVSVLTLYFSSSSLRGPVPPFQHPNAPTSFRHLPEKPSFIPLRF